MIEEIRIRPTVLLYNIRGFSREQSLRNYLTAEGIDLIDVGQADYGKPLGALLGLPGFEDAKDAAVGAPRTDGAPPFDDEMLVMFAFREGMLDDLIRFFREAGLPSVALKAMVTPTNISWSSTALHDAIAEEHEVMRRMRGK